MATQLKRARMNRPDSPCFEAVKVVLILTNDYSQCTFGLLPIPQNVTLTQIMDLLAYSNDSEVSGSNAPWRRDGLRDGALLTGQLEEKMSLLMRVAPNIVQAIRAFNVGDLQQEAGQLGHHFLYAHCANTLTKQQVCARIGEQFYFPKPCSKNFDALRKCLTETVHEAGPQPGFIVVLEQLPSAQKFDKEARENLLDVFRDAAEFWAEKKVPFRVFYSFATVPPTA